MFGPTVLLPLFKKGDKRICSNYRGISLIDVAAKVFGVIPLTDARIRCTTYVAYWSSVAGSSKLSLFASVFDSVERDSV